jgi:hypothetical protein
MMADPTIYRKAAGSIILGPNQNRKVVLPPWGEKGEGTEKEQRKPVEPWRQIRPFTEREQDP